MSGHVSKDERGPLVDGPSLSPPVSGPSPAPLGAAMRGVREQQGRSLADVSRSINLRETVVAAMERDDFTLCGGDVYARGHIRAYARLLGIDPAPLLRSYEERSGVPAPGARVALLTDDDVPLERGRPNWAVLAGVALTVVVALLGWQLVDELRGPARPTEQVAPAGLATTPPTTGADSGPAAPSSSPTSTATSTASGAGATTAPTTAAPVSPDRVAVALRITGQSWVEVRDAKGRTVWSGLLGKGDAKRFSDTSALRLTLGNAGGVELTVNGTSLGLAGKAGEVKRLTFRPGEAAELS
jgi:cytoskeleton protein RodZ